MYSEFKYRRFIIGRESAAFCHLNIWKFLNVCPKFNSLNFIRHKFLKPFVLELYKIGYGGLWFYLGYESKLLVMSFILKLLKGTKDL